jgi:hypothetical protein
MLETVFLIAALILALYVWRTRLRLVAWREIHRHYSKDFSDPLSNQVFGAGLGFIGDQGYSFIVSKAVKSGVYIEKKLPPLNLLYRPISIPWNAIAKIEIKPTPRYSLKTAAQDGPIEAVLFLQDTRYQSIVVPWREEFQPTIPASVIFKDDLQNE